MAGFITRPVVMGRRGVVTSGHYLATAAGFRIMEQGGNAIDAAAAMCFCLNLLEPQSNGIGGEVPTLIYSASEGKTYEISGMGWSAAAFTVDWCRENGIDLVPGDGYLPACVPATVGTWAAALIRFGTMTFAQVLQPAIELAEEGFAMYGGLATSLAANQKKYTELYPSTGEVYLPNGRPPVEGDLFRNPDWGTMLRMICRGEEAASGGREEGIRAGRDVFYKGEIADRIVEFMRDNPVLDASGSEHAGLLTLEDMAGWEARIEAPASYNYRGLEVHKCSSWTQGPVFLQQLALLECYNLVAMGHNSADYLHTLIEVAKLAFADREAYYGDPLFDEVPFADLLSRDYSRERMQLIDQTASRDLRPGQAGGGVPDCILDDVAADNRRALDVAARAVKDLGQGHAHIGDTTHLDAVDAQGNMVAATPSGGWLGTSPVIRGLGFPMGTRGQMFYLNPERPNALQPHKRPRATLTPTLVTRGGEPYMVFGTPGGDSQDQWTLQFFLNVVDFGMNLQEALDAPTVHSEHFPSSFYPRRGFPAQVAAEERLPAEVLSELERRGHQIVKKEGWSHGKVLGIRRDSDRGLIHGAAAAKNNIGYALGW